MTGSKKSDCPFELLGVKFSNEHGMLKVVYGLHNHLPIAQIKGHSYTGQFIKKEKEIMIAMSNNLVKSRNILMTLKVKDEKNVNTIKIIYNTRQKYKVIDKCGRSQIQQLMKKLKDCNYVE